MSNLIIWSMKFDLINNDIFNDAAISPDASNWLESDDITDDDLCSSLRSREWLEDELLLPDDFYEAVDIYLNRGSVTGRRFLVRELW